VRSSNRGYSGTLVRGDRRGAGGPALPIGALRYWATVGLAPERTALKNILNVPYDCPR